MKRYFVFLGLLSMLIYGLSFGLNFGGGTFVGYIPGNMIKLPVEFGLKFENGIVLFGGRGEGGVNWHMGGIGGSGSKMITDNSGNEYTLGALFGMAYGTKSLSFGDIGIETGLGFGGFSYTLNRVVNDSNTDTEELDMSINYFIISPMLKLSVNIMPMMEIYGEATGIAGYSMNGWRYETGSSVSGIDQDNYKFLINYMLSVGIEWGY